MKKRYKILFIVLLALGGSFERLLPLDVLHHKKQAKKINQNGLMLCSASHRKDDICEFINQVVTPDNLISSNNPKNLQGVGNLESYTNYVLSFSGQSINLRGVNFADNGFSKKQLSESKNIQKTTTTNDPATPKKFGTENLLTIKKVTVNDLDNTIAKKGLTLHPVTVIAPTLPTTTTLTTGLATPTKHHVTPIKGTSLHTGVSSASASYYGLSGLFTPPSTTKKVVFVTNIGGVGLKKNVVNSADAGLKKKKTVFGSGGLGVKKKNGAFVVKKDPTPLHVVSSFSPVEDKKGDTTSPKKNLISMFDAIAEADPNDEETKKTKPYVIVSETAKDSSKKSLPYHSDEKESEEKSIIDLSRTPSKSSSKKSVLLSKSSDHKKLSSVIKAKVDIFNFDDVYDLNCLFDPANHPAESVKKLDSKHSTPEKLISIMKLSFSEIKSEKDEYKDISVHTPKKLDSKKDKENLSESSVIFGDFFDKNHSGYVKYADFTPEKIAESIKKSDSVYGVETISGIVDSSSVKKYGSVYYGVDDISGIMDSNSSVKKSGGAYGVDTISNLSLEDTPPKKNSPIIQQKLPSYEKFLDNTISSYGFSDHKKGFDGGVYYELEEFLSSNKKDLADILSIIKFNDFDDEKDQQFFLDNQNLPTKRKLSFGDDFSMIEEVY
jgi:hypothetical protein